MRGEAIVTRTGLEGGGIYALSAPIRDALDAAGEAILHIDLRPDLTATALTNGLARRAASNRCRRSCARPRTSRRSRSDCCRRRRSHAARGFPRCTPEALAGLIKEVPVRLTGIAPTSPGRFRRPAASHSTRSTPRFMLRRQPGIFVAGEMLDWEAPTGGYLLQACLLPAWRPGMARSRGSGAQER